MSNTDNIDFESLINQLPDRFQDTEILKFVSIPAEYSEKYNKRFYANEVANVLMELGLIAQDYDSMLTAISLKFGT